MTRHTGRPKKKGDMEIGTVSFLIQLYLNLGSNSLPVKANFVIFLSKFGASAIFSI